MTKTEWFHYDPTSVLPFFKDQLIHESLFLIPGISFWVKQIHGNDNSPIKNIMFILSPVFVTLWLPLKLRQVFWWFPAMALKKMALWLLLGGSLMLMVLVEIELLMQMPVHASLAFLTALSKPWQVVYCLHNSLSQPYLPPIKSHRNLTIHWTLAIILGMQAETHIDTALPQLVPLHLPSLHHLPMANSPQTGSICESQQGTYHKNSVMAWTQTRSVCKCLNYGTRTWFD